MFVSKPNSLPRPSQIYSYGCLILMCWFSDPSEPYDRWHVSTGQRSPPESLLPVVFQLLALLDLLPLLLQLIEPGGQLIALVEQLPHLSEQHGVGQEEAAELVVEAKVVVLDLGSHADYYRQIQYQLIYGDKLIFDIYKKYAAKMHQALGHKPFHWRDDQLAGRGSVTESQIMNTLNSSIEDLLSKISKVTEDYECSSHEEPQNQSQFHVSILRENTLTGNSDEPCLFRRKEAKTGEKSTFYSSQSQKESFQSSENIYQTNYPLYQLSRNATTLHIASNQIPSPINKSSSSKSMHQEPQSKMGKIQSLFDSTSIKEVAESQIFGQDGGEGGCGLLDQSTREVEQVIVCQQDNQMDCEHLSLREFQIGAEVGSGKFGEVYICRHKATGLIFALKKIFKSTIKQYGMEQQFCLQLKILYMLNHPNIIKLYGHFSDEYHIFLLMEYVEGGELITKLKSQERYVSRMLEQLINAIDYIHDRGIVHRDIKPENVVIAFDNTVKLCDFGWAGLFDYKNMKTTFCGTLDYVSPEMKDIGAYGSSVDIWSLGVLTFELLTGNAPFKDEIMDWKKKGSKRSVAWDWNIMYPAEVSGLGQSFMRNLLKQNPDQRASLRSCKNHLFIRKHKLHESQINIELYI